jgi:predicted dehydrogenase
LAGSAKRGAILSPLLWDAEGCHNRRALGQRQQGERRLRPPPASGFPSAKAPIGWLRSHVACLADSLAAIAQGRPAAPALRQGLRVEQLMDAACRSAAGRRWIEV